MQDFWQYAGSYWWLIFPLMGIAGGMAKAWERGARYRHERRMEVLHAKAEIKTAQVQARELGRHRPVEEAPTAATQAEALQKLFDEHDAVTARWLDYELDVAKLIAFPAMSDGRQPLTAAFLRAKKVADRLRPASTKAKPTKEQFDEYRSAVTDYEVAFDVAEQDARRLRDSTFTETERKRLDTAKQLLTVAIDEAATPAERQIAYKRVREELNGLISLSDGAIEVLEKKVALQLPAGATLAPPTPRADPARAATPRPNPAPPATASPATASPAAAPPTDPWPPPRRSHS